MEKQLQEIDAQQGGIRPGNESVVLKGDASKVVFLLHGFLGSPFEVRLLGESLNRQGYSVVMPLLRGYGRGTKEAALTTAEEWLTSTEAQLKASGGCGGKIQVVGFSLGALVETKILLDHPEIREKIASLTLLSPALFLQDQSMMRAGATILSTINDAPDVSSIARFARRTGNYDLDIPEAYPEFYSAEISLDSVKQITRLITLVDYSLFSELRFPVKLIYSEADHTVAAGNAWATIQPYLPSIRDYVIRVERAIPHQLLLADQGMLVDEISTEVTRNFSSSF